jgi:UDP-2-acetamido-3-amino-2,3-dideoxy-glucuronate N-acetyltransferase
MSTALPSSSLPSQSMVLSRRVGQRPSIGAYSHVGAEAVLGDDVLVAQMVLIDGDVTLGNGVRVECGARLYGPLSVQSEVTIGCNACFTRDLPHGGRLPPSAETRTSVRRGALIEANATVMAGVNIGEHARVCAGAVVKQDVPAFAIVAGNPSRIVGYVDALPTPGRGFDAVPGALQPPVRVRGAGLVSIPQVVDMRGVTCFAETEKHLPFVARRFFFVSDVPGREVRGEHAHKTLHEFLVCLRGSVSVMLDDGHVRDEIRLDEPTLGLHVPPQVWRVVYKFSHDALMLSLCSHVYDPDDYIRDYSDFLSFVGAK